MSDVIYQYTPGEMDWLLLNWMTRMHHDGELEHTLSLGTHTPYAFLSFMAARQLFFKMTDLMNISYAAWFEPCMGNTFMGFYVSPDFRDQHEEKVFWLFDMINLAFTAGAKTVAGLIQERDTTHLTQKLVKLHIRLGYVYCGVVPHFFDGKNCHVVAYTAENWEALRDYGWQTRWRKSRKFDTTAFAQSGVNGVVAAGQ